MPLRRVMVGLPHMKGKHLRPTPRRWPRRVLIGTNVIVALTLIGTIAAWGYVRYRLDQIKHIDVPGLAAVGSDAPGSQSKPPDDRQSSGSDDTPPFTTLVIGSDTRSLVRGDSSAYGNPTETPGQRSDSIVLLRVAPGRKSLAILSIPRDTLVAIPGLGTTKINAAFNAGTPNLLVKVLAQDFGIQVNHVVEFNFDTFEDIANAIGGVYQYFPAPAMDAKSDLNIPKAGCVLLTGTQALAFARSRYYEYYLDGDWHYQQDPESDLGRIQRQQDFVKLAAKKAQRIAPTSPFALNKLISSLTTGIKLDTSFSNSLLLSLIKDYRNANLADIPSYTYPTTNDGAALDPDVALGKQTIAQWLDVGQTPPPTTPSTTTTEPARTAPAAPVTSTTTLAPSSVTVEVVNGSGTAGQATLTSRQLKKLGYQATTGGNGAFDHPQTIIDYAPDSLTAAQLLETKIDGPAVLTLNTSLAATPYNLEVVTGQNYTGITSGTGSAASGPPTSAPATTTTTVLPLTDPGLVGSSTVQPDSSSFYKGQYIPPGREPGQVPPTCPD